MKTGSFTKTILLGVFFFFFGLMTSNAQDAFITEWNTGSSTSITVPTTGSGYDYTAILKLKSDGSTVNILNNASGNASFTGLSISTDYIVEITGNFPRIYFNNTGDKTKIRKITQWGTQAWTSFEKAFFGCKNLELSATDIPSLTGVTNLSLMFINCISLSGPSANWNWNTANITSMDFMFSDATSFNQNIGSWNTANVTNMNALFYNATSFNQDIGSWNTGKVINMNYMFNNTASFNQNIGNWNTGSVTNMGSMFGRATSFNQNIGNWNTANVTDMSSMFFGADSFNQNIGNWNTGNVTDMSSMFYASYSFNQDISNWNTGNITNMNDMFNNTASFNQNIGAWNLNKVKNMDGMLSYSGMNCSNYGATLTGWTNNPATPGDITLGANGIKYSSAATDAHYTLTTTKNWTITDDGPDPTCDDIVAIQLLYFKVRKDLNLRQANLTWETDKNSNNNYFEIVRSENGNDWETISKVIAAAGESNFSALDKNPKDFNYYRLRMVDLDEKITYSKVLTADFPKLNHQISVYPNPNKGTFILNAQAGQDYTIADVSGKIIKTGKLAGSKTTLNIHQLPNGLYFIKVGTEVLKIIKN